MPQATRALQLAWDHDNEMDGKALKHLEGRGFTFDKGMIAEPEGQTPTDEDWSAICYLCQEWDYDWEGCD